MTIEEARASFKFIRSPGARVRFSAGDIQKQHDFSDGILDVLAERAEQIDRHGFTLDHDLHHHPADLVAAAVSYANTGHDQLHGKDYPRDEVDPGWPWEGEAWRPGTARDNLVKAAALLLAAIDRVDAAPRDSGEEPPITAAELPY